MKNVNVEKGLHREMAASRKGIAKRHVSPPSSNFFIAGDDVGNA